jgi:lipopolysaccharide transport system ATP-binding protein
MAYGILDLAKNLVGIKPDSSKPRKDEFWALDNVSFDLRSGESVALIGLNGSGKTTLLRLLTGIFPPDKGEIMVKGRVGALIAVGAGFHPHMTGRENIYLNGNILGMSREDIDLRYHEIIDFAEIGDFVHAPIATYSSGMRVRLGFAIAVQINPQVLLIDEILAVGDVGFRMKCFNKILSLMNEGTTVIVVSHNLAELSRVTDCSIVLDNGKAIYNGSLAIGIGRYQNLIRVQKKHEEKYVESKTYIESVRLFNEEGQETREFLTGDTLVAEVSLKTTEIVRNARLVVNIFSPSNGLLGSFSTPYKGFNFDVTPPVSKISFIMPDLPLLIGGYHFEISLYGPEIVDFYDIKVPIAKFQVVGPPINTFGYGICHTFKFKHDWK